MNTTLDSLNLNRSEQKALELCGIDRLSQLAAASPDQLSRDLAAAERLFPGQELHMSLQRLTDLCNAAQRALSEAGASGRASASELPQPPDPSTLPGAPVCPAPARTAELSRAAVSPEPPLTPEASALRDAPAGRTPSAGQAAAPESRPLQRAEAAVKRRVVAEEFTQATAAPPRRRRTKGLDNYHAAHPVALVLASVFLLLTLLGALLLVIASVYLMMDEEPPLPALGILIACAVTGIAYLLCLTRCQCVICRGRMCSVFSHKRGRHAHYVPLLGHTIPTAFAILFTLSTVCPHCNTRQSIIGGFRPASRFHHHR